MPKDHLVVYPNVTIETTMSLQSVRLDHVDDICNLQKIDLINLDVQGAELQALQGFTQLLDTTTAVYSEVNTRELYEGCAKFEDLDRWLSEKGFTLVDWHIHKEGWGDAVWIRGYPKTFGCRLRRLLRRVYSLNRNVRHRLQYRLFRR